MAGEFSSSVVVPVEPGVDARCLAVAMRLAEPTLQVVPRGTGRLALIADQGGWGIARSGEIEPTPGGGSQVRMTFTITPDDLPPGTVHPQQLIEDLTASLTVAVRRGSELARRIAHDGRASVSAAASVIVTHSADEVVTALIDSRPSGRWVAANVRDRPELVEQETNAGMRVNTVFRCAVVPGPAPATAELRLSWETTALISGTGALGLPESRAQLAGLARRRGHELAAELGFTEFDPQVAVTLASVRARGAVREAGRAISNRVWRGGRSGTDGIGL